MKHEHVIGPLILIAVGMFFFVNNMVIDLPIRDLMRRGWPFLLIGIGVVQLITLPARIARGRSANLTGPIVLITIGSLFALQTIWEIRFRDTWPLIPIAIGVALLAQNAVTPMNVFRRFGGGR